MYIETLSNFIKFAVVFNISLTAVNLKKFKKVEDETKYRITK